MKSRFPHVSWIVLALVFATAQGAEDPELSLLLERLDRLSQLYEDSVLSFTCNERITYRGKGTKSYDYSYLYVLDDNGQPRDLRRAKGLGKELAPEPRGADLPAYLLRPYSAVFIFQTAKRGRFEFEILGRGEALGRPAIEVGFEAVPPYVVGDNAWFGTAWVDRDSFQLLRVEAYDPESRENRLALEKAREEALRRGPVQHSVHQVSRFDVEFGVVENGMRFPSRVFIEKRKYEVPFDVERNGHRVWTVAQTYKRYRFYSTRTEEQIHAFVKKGKAD